MALRNQPYFPFYVNDFTSDEKLILCSAESTGVYIRIMCLMHKSDEYGVILLKQNFKQSSKQEHNFALLFAKFMPYDLSVIESALDELIAAGVLILDGDRLYQKRMVKDEKISQLRVEAGRKGGLKTQKSISRKDKKESEFATDFDKAKNKANTEYVNEDETVIECETNDGFTEAIKHFKEHRKKLKKPMTDHAVDLLKKDLQRYAPDNVAAQIEMIDRAIMKGWQTVYPIDEKTQPQKDGERNAATVNDKPSKPPEQERRKFYYTDTDGKVKEGVR